LIGLEKVSGRVICDLLDVRNADVLLPGQYAYLPQPQQGWEFHCPPRSLTSEYGKRNAGGEVLAIRSSERIDETFSGLAFRTILALAFGLENVSAI
jgi:hypothetical protein